MPAFNLKNWLGIDGTVAWVVSADHFTDLLDLVYAHHCGEIWLFNNDLKVFRDADLFRQIYLRKIAVELASQIRCVKILLNDEIKECVFPQPKDWMRARLDAWCRQREQSKAKRIPELLFGRTSEAFNLSTANQLLNAKNIPPHHSWIFYLHGASLSRTRQNGLALLRPTQFPFAPHDQPLALSWHLSDDTILSAEHKQAFTESFSHRSLFWRLGPDRSLTEASPEYIENATAIESDQPEGIAFGEEADVLVLAPAVDELEYLRRQLTEGIRRIPAPAGSSRRYECWTRRGERHVVLATIGEGNISAAVATTRLLERFKPRHVILLGVAGAIPEGRVKYEIGDVVVGQTTIWYEWGTVSEKKSIWAFWPKQASWIFRPKRDISTAWGGEDATRILYQMASEFVGTSLTVGMDEAKRPPGVSRSPKVALAIIGSGSKIVASNQFIKDVIHRVDSKINTFETEAAGVSQACASFPEHHVDSLIVRGIMDMADGRTRKDDVRKQYRDYARASCAEFVARLLEKL